MADTVKIITPVSVDSMKRLKGVSYEIFNKKNTGQIFEISKR